MSFVGNWQGRKAVQLHRKGQTEAAIAAYEKAYQNGMDDLVMLKNYAGLLVRERRFDEACKLYQMIDKKSGVTEADRNDIIANYAIALWGLGDLSGAIELCKHRLLRGRNGALYSVLGYLLIESGNIDDAIRINTEALEYDAEDAIFLDNMGQVYFRLLHDQVKAEPYFKRALDIRPSSIDSNYFLAQIEISKGDYESAAKRLSLAEKGRFTTLNYATPAKIKELLSFCKEKGKI